MPPDVVKRLLAPGLLALFVAALLGGTAPPGDLPLVPAGRLAPRIAGFPLPSAGPAPDVHLEAHIEENTRARTSIARYPVLAPDGRRLRDATYRVVTGTGNCCENYLGSSPNGRLFDFGGAFLEFSDDEGVTWKSVRPRQMMFGGEGAVVVAPNGDVVGIGWAWTLDVVMPFKYDASQERWFYSYTKLHQPLFDRPTIAVIPGPFQIAGTKVPYISVLRGGLPLVSKTPWFFSVDGLNYVLPNVKLFDGLRNPPDSGSLQVDRWKALDWIQSHEQAGIVPIGRGGAVSIDPSIPDWFDDLGPQLLRLRDDLTWARHDLPAGDLPGPRYGSRLAADSNGWLHYVRVVKDNVVYMLSPDGGGSWKKDVRPLPRGLTMPDWMPYFTSLRVNGEHDLAVIALHAAIKGQGNVTQDLVLSYSTRSGAPRLERFYLLGNGDLGTGSGSGTSGARFDFSTVTLLPDGRFAASFSDGSHPEPAVAILLDGGSNR